jgi:hypothetical protein
MIIQSKRLVKYARENQRLLKAAPAAAAAARATEQTFSYVMTIMIIVWLINLELWEEDAVLEYISVVAWEDVISEVMLKRNGAMRQMPSLVAIGEQSERRERNRSANWS